MRRAQMQPAQMQPAQMQPAQMQPAQMQRAQMEYGLGVAPITGRNRSHVMKMAAAA